MKTKTILGIHYIYWTFWLLLYLAVTANGHIYRFVEAGILNRDNALNFVAGWEYIYLPILMAILLGWAAHVFSAKKFIFPMVILGLLFSRYIHYDLLVIGHTMYVVALGILSFGIVRTLEKVKNALTNSDKT
ncbi:MAG: hypothetical protein Q7S48_04925 [bacterium]|nr:hypothetical protein [bacterium]